MPVPRRQLHSCGFKTEKKNKQWVENNTTSPSVSLQLAVKSLCFFFVLFFFNLSSPIVPLSSHGHSCSVHSITRKPHRFSLAAENTKQGELVIRS